MGPSIAMDSHHARLGTSSGDRVVDEFIFVRVGDDLRVAKFRTES